MPYLNVFFKSGSGLRIGSLGFYMSLMPLAMLATFARTIVCYCAATLLLSRKFLRAEIKEASTPPPVLLEKPET